MGWHQTAGGMEGDSGEMLAAAKGAESITGVFGLSVEVPEPDAAVMAASDDVRVVVLDPGADPAMESGG